MSRIFDKKTHKFINPKRTRVRFYSKLFKKYYTVWISKGLIMTKGLGAHIILCEVLNKGRFEKSKEIEPVESYLTDYQWEVIIEKREERIKSIECFSDYHNEVADKDLDHE